MSYFYLLNLLDFEIIGLSLNAPKNTHQFNEHLKTANVEENSSFKDYESQITNLIKHKKGYLKYFSDYIK